MWAGWTWTRAPTGCWSAIRCPWPDEDGTRAKIGKEARALGRKAEFEEADYEKMPDEYSKCRYVILPSKYEGFPLTLLEAAAMERPFVSTDVGQVKSVMEKLGLDTRKFLLAGSVGDKIAELEKEKLGAQMKAARKKLSAYSWESVARKTAAVYRDAIGA
ncbi:MAG: glycosyltransferase [Candidatus Micrarchaeota archaeon]|nr:glycosyltransferase [Candidatus Micrarchaeota archaeon]